MTNNTGQSVKDSFAVFSTDGTEAQVVVTVTGTDDAAEIGGDTAGAVTEDADESVARGTLTVVDPDTELSGGDRGFTAQPDVKGTYGTFTLGAGGAWTYTLDNADPDTNGLGADEEGTERFTVESAGGVSGVVVVTVTGSNDAAEIGGDTAGAVTEDAEETVARGTLTVSDPDAGQAGFKAQTPVKGTYGTFTLDADGAWTYTLDNADSDTDALGSWLGAGDFFAVFSTDGTEAQVVVTVTGSNDAAEIDGDTAGAVTEDAVGTEASGTLEVSDPDAGQAGFKAQTPVKGTYGTFTLDADGSWTYTLDNADADTDALGVGETVEDSFAVESVDGTEAQVVVTVTGSDDAAVIGGDSTGAVTEDAEETRASGTLEVSDVDTTLTEEQRQFKVQASVAGTYGTFTLDADGAWTYTLDNADADTDALKTGQTRKDTFAVESADGTGAQVVITVTGSDDGGEQGVAVPGSAAEIGGDTAGAVTEDAEETVARGTLTVSDPDADQSAFTVQNAATGMYGTFTLGADGRWTYTLDNADADTNALGAGETVTDTFAVASVDGSGSQVVVTVTGANDAAVIGGDTEGAVTEDDVDAAQASGTLTVRDPDTGQAALTEQADVEGTYGTFTLGADGTWTYTLDNTDADTNALGAGQTGTDTFTVRSVDRTVAQVEVTVTGSDDEAVVGGDSTGAVTEDAAETEASGALSVSDPDATPEQRLFIAQTQEGTYGTFTLGSNGAWTYTLDNDGEDTDALRAGDVVTERFTVASVDGAEGAVVVTVTGANDAAVIGGDTEGTVTEDDVDAAQASGTLTVRDPDTGQAAFTEQADVEGTYGTFTLGADGTWTYTLDNADEDTNALGAGQTGTDTFTVRSVDRTVAQVEVTVTGADDAAVIGGDSTGAVTEDADETEASGTLTVNDPDADQSEFTAQTKVGTYGTFTLGEDGTWTYTLDNTDEDTDALGAGQKETERFTVTSVGGTTAQVVVTVTGADDAAVIGGDSTGAVTEDADETEASGTLTVSDPDADQSEFTAQTKVGTYGTFALGEGGEWTYTLDNTDEDTDALGAGEKVTDTFEVTSVGGTTAQVVVTVTGADDAAVIGGDSTGAVTEDADETEASGTLTVSDPDADQSEFTAQTKVGTYGTFALGEDGEWTYTLDNTDEDTDALGAGEKVTDAFEVTSVGGTTAQVVVTVTGADDAAVIGGDSTGAVIEDDADETEASGTLTVSDPDADQSAFTVQTKVGTYGTFALGEDGEWTYTLDNTDEDTDALGAGEKVTDTFEVTSVGGTTAQVVVTVTGADDAAVIGGDSTGAVTEDADETEASGTLTVSDPDADQSAFTVQTKVGTYGTFALGEDGEWTYTLDNTDEDTDALGAGEKVTDTFTVASVDGTGAQVVITVTGADDAAVIGGDSTGAVTEDDADETEASGTLTVSDPDADQSAFTVQTKVGTYGTFALGEDGEWTYTLDNTDEDTDALGAGQKETERFTVTSVGGTTAQVVVTVTGADDAAVIGGDSTGAVTEDADETEASGTLTVSDPDADQSEFTAQTKVGTYGTFALGEDGEWTYTLDNTDEDTDALGAGEKVTDAFEVTSVGGTTAQVVVTVTGADDAAVIGGDSTGAVTEDADETEASGTLTVSDPDADQSAFTVQTKVGTYGTFALGEDGEWTYTLDNTDEDTDALGAGEKVTDTFEVTSVGGTTAQVVVTVTGADDAAVIGGDSTGAVTEDADETEASGTLTVSDPDADQSAFTVQTKVGTYGTFALGEDGEWTYTLDNTDEDTDALGAGEKVTDTFEVTSVGGTTAQVVVTVTGADDAAVIGGDSTGAVTEDADETEASGTLTVSDPDADQSAFTVQTKVGTYGTFALGEDGEWTYTLDNTDEDTDALGAGEKVTDTFTVASVDGTGAQVVITVTGADDAAVIGGDSTGAVTEDDADETEASGTLTVSDPDADQSAFTVQTKVGTYGTFALGEDGEWTYTLDNTDEDTDALGAGQKETERFTVTSVGGTTAQVVVTVTGADDAAVIGGDSTGAVTEDADETEASGTLTVSDPDADQSEFTAQTKVGTYGTFALGEDGEWTYTLDNTDEDTDALGAGEKVTDAFEVTSVGGTTAQVVVTVTGADDAAVIGGDSTGAVTEDADETEASGTLTVSDPDADQSAFTVQTKVGTYGTFALGEDGEWTYTLDNTDEDTDALGAGEKVTDTFEVTSVGGTTAQVEVTVTGADDAAVIGGDSTGAVTEDDASAATASGTLTVSDPDANQSAFTAQTDVVGTYGTFTLGEDGGWRYTLDNEAADTNALGSGEKVTDTFTVASVDGTTAQVVVTVTGADDAAVIGGELTGAVTEDAEETGASGTLTVSDPDAGQSAFTAQTKVGTYGTFTLGEDGGWTYTLDNEAADTDALVAGQTETDTFEVSSVGGTVSQVVVTVTGADDAAVIGGDSTGAVTEDDASAATASGTLTVSDPDANQSAFTAQTDVVGTYGTFTLGEDGGWTYTLDNADADTDALGSGETGTDTFTVASLDGTTAQVEIVVRGANEAAVIDTTPAVEPDDEPAIIPIGDPENSAPRLPFGGDIGEPDQDPVQLPDSNGDELPAPEALLTMELRHETIFKDGFMLETGKPERNELKLISYWSMDKLYGNVLYDSAGDLQNAIFFAADGTPELVKPDAATEFGLRDGGAAARFDGNKATYIAIAHDDEFEVGTGTVMFWFNADDTRGKQVLFAKDAAGPGNHLKIGLDGASLEIRMQNAADSHSIATDDIIEAGAWYHLILSFGPDGMKLYVNGVQVGENAAAVGLQDNREPIVIGGSNHLNDDQSGDLSRLRVDDSFSGRIDEVMVYGRELDDRQALYLHERDATMFADSGSVLPASASTGEDWVWDAEAPEDGDAGADDILVRASEYVPVPDVPDWLMEVHETGFDDGYASELLAGTLVGLGVQGSRRSAGRRERNDTGELMG